MSSGKDGLDKDKSRIRGGGAGQRGDRGAGRGGRPGERRRDNDRNGGASFKVDTFRADGENTRSRGGAGRGSYNSRGRGGRGGDNRTNFRGPRPARNQPDEMGEIDSWEPVSNNQPKQEVQIDTWGDWDNEEYTGSLKDTKVFTPSTSTTSHGVISSQASELSAPPGLEQQMLNPPSQQPPPQVDSYSSITGGSQQSQVTAAGTNQAQYPEIHSGTTAAQHLRQALEMPQIASATLTAEQSQYFNTLSSQNSNVVNSYQTTPVQYQPGYGTQTPYGTTADQVQQQAPQARRPQARARVPPPSKIPSSAVEMPGDALNNIGYLDVQFGGLDFGTDESFESVPDKFGSTVLETSQTIPSAEVSDYQSKSTANKSSLSSSGLQTSQIMSNNDSLSSQTDNLSSSYSQRTASNVPSSVNSGATNYQLNKTDPYIQGNTNQGSGYQTSTYSTQNKTPSYQPSQGYGTTSYANSAQVSSNNNYPPASNNTYNSYSQSYQQQTSNSTAGTGGVGGGSVSSNNNSSQSIPVNNSSVTNNK